MQLNCKAALKIWYLVLYVPVADTKPHSAAFSFSETDPKTALAPSGRSVLMCSTAT